MTEPTNPSPDIQHFSTTLHPTGDGSGDALPPLPPEIVAALGLTENCTVEAEIDSAGRLILSSAENVDSASSLLADALAEMPDVGTDSDFECS